MVVKNLFAFCCHVVIFVKSIYGMHSQVHTTDYALVSTKFCLYMFVNCHYHLIVNERMN